MSYFGAFSTLPNATAHLSASTYGDVIVRKCLTSSGTECSVQHNYAQFMNKPGLIPFVAGFPVPFMNLSLYGEGRLAGRAESDEKWARENLICSELTETGRGVRVFSIASNSDRRHLIVSEIDFDTNSTAEIDYGLVKLNKLPSHVESKDLEKPAVELRTFEAEETSKRLFIRNQCGLAFYNFEDDKTHSLFDEKVVSFFQIPGLEDSIALLDDEKMVWYGQLGRNLARKKTIFEPNDISPTTCPRVLLLANYSEARMLDLRDNKPDAQLLFHLPDLRDKFLVDSATRHVMDVADEQHKEKIIHSTAINGRPYSTILSTNHYHYLVDQRVPSKAILIMPHSVLQDDTVCFSTPGVRDFETKNFVHNFMSLDRSEGTVSCWPVLIDVTHNMWSSVSSMKTFPDSRMINQYCKSTTNQKTRLNCYNLPKKTTAFCCQPIPQVTSAVSISLLLQQMEDNSLWYSNVMTHTMDEKVLDLNLMRLDSVKCIRKYYSGLVEDADDEALEKVLNKPKNTDFVSVNCLQEDIDLVDLENLTVFADGYELNLRDVEEARINPATFRPDSSADEGEDLIGYYMLKCLDKALAAFRIYLRRVDNSQTVAVERGQDHLLPFDEEVGNSSDDSTAAVVSQKPVPMEVVMEDDDDFDYGELPF